MENEILTVKAIIEILGYPKEHVQETMNRVVEIVKKDYKLEDSKIHEPKELDKFWSTFVELELKIKKIDDLIGFCFDFMPSSIEIVEPSRLNVKTSEIANLFNDLLARLHQYDMIVKNLSAQNKLLQEEKKK